MKKIFLFLLLGINSAFAATDDFSYQNRPINPACVAMFNSSLADAPYLKSINLSECQNSNAAYQKTLKNDDGSYYFYINDKDYKDGSYGYKVYGKSTNGNYVLGTSSSGGGTLIASDLLLIRLDNSNQYVYDGNSDPQVNPIIEMKLLGYAIGGDRCVGSFANIQVVGNQLIIKQYAGNNPLDCDKVKTYSIDLSKLS